MKKIKKGKYGKLSKIREEFQELEKAVFYNNELHILSECADLVGSIDRFVKKRFNNFVDVQDLLKMFNSVKGHK